MIRINFTPPEQLENKFWYIPDAIVAAVAYILIVYFAGEYLATKDAKIAELDAEYGQVNRSYQNIKADTEQFQNLENEVAQLRVKLNVLQQITVSKTAKFESVIVMEHLQTLKPEGLWYETVDIKSSEGQTIKIEGRAFDPILIAEFMTSLNETKLQKIDGSDLRSAVYFNSVTIVEITQNKKNGADGNKEKENISDVSRFPKFSLEIDYGVREGFMNQGTLN